MSRLDLIKRAYLALTILADDFDRLDDDIQKVIDDLKAEIKRLSVEKR